MRLHLLAGAAVTFCFATSAANAQYDFDIRTLVLSEEPAQGTNADFARFFSVFGYEPTVTPSGFIHFGGRAGTDWGLWSADPLANHEVSLFALAGEPITNGERGDTWRVPPRPLIDEDNRVIGRITVAASGREGITIGEPGNLSLIARTDYLAPGYDDGTRYARNEFLQPAANRTGHIAFGTELVLGSGRTAGPGLFERLPDEQVRLVLGPAMQAPGLPEGSLVEAARRAAINDDGLMAFGGQLVVDTGDVTRENSSVLWGGFGDNTQLLLRGGDSIGGQGIFDRVLLIPTIGNSGQIALWAGLKGTTRRNQAIVGGPMDDLRVIARKGTRGPGMAQDETWTSNHGSVFWQPLISDDGNAAFYGSIRAPDSGLDLHGLWFGNADNLEMVTRSGHPILEFGAGVVIGGASREFAMNPKGDILFRAGLLGEGVDSSNNLALFVWLRGLGLQPVLRTGQEIEVRPGDFRVLADFRFSTGSAGQDGFATVFNNSGLIAYTAMFTDGSSGGFYSTVPTPPAAIPLLGCLALAMSRRRQQRA